MENEFFFLFRRYELRDTANYRPIVWTAGEFNVPKLKLKKLVQTLLGYQIQVGEHCPAEDAQAAMHLYKKFQVGWDEFLSRKTKPRKHYEPPNNLPSTPFKSITYSII